MGPEFNILTGQRGWGCSISGISTHSEVVSLRHYRNAKARRVDAVLTLAGIGQGPAANVVSLAERRTAKQA